MVDIACFWTWYRIGPLYRPSERSQNMHRLSRTWLAKVTLLVTIGQRLVATAQGAVKMGAFTDDACASIHACRAVTRGVVFPDDACASTKSRCAVSKKKEGGVLFRMSLAPPRNHVAQCQKTRSTLLINY